LGKFLHQKTAFDAGDVANYATPCKIGRMHHLKPVLPVNTTTEKQFNSLTLAFNSVNG